MFAVSRLIKKLKGANLKSSLFLVIALLILSGCSTVQISSLSSIDGSQGSSESIRNDLSRHSTEYGYYSIEALPATPALTDAEYREDDSMSVEGARIFSTAARTAGESRTCFSVKMNTLGYSESQPIYWEVLLSAPGQDEERLIIDDRQPVRIKRSTKYGYKYLSESLFCSYKVTDLKKGFRLVFVPREDWVGMPPAMMTWTFQ